MRRASDRWNRSWVVLIALLCVPSLLGIVSHANASPVRLGPIVATITSTTSLNWGGYADVATTNAVTAVSAQWNEPKVTCPSRGTLYAAFWVGIDGYNSGTVEQDGTLATCSAGTASYSAWWELYPLNSIQTITSITVHSGDSMSASVTYSSSGFTMAITDVTTGKSFSTTGTQTGVARSSAECIAERPSVGGSLSKLANFGTMSFTSCTATVGGTSTGIGAYSSASAITMVNKHGATLTSPSTTSNSGANFSMKWVRSS